MILKAALIFVSVIGGILTSTYAITQAGRTYYLNGSLFTFVS